MSGEQLPWESTLNLKAFLRENDIFKRNLKDGMEKVPLLGRAMVATSLRGVC